MKKAINKLVKIVLLIAMIFSDLMTPISVLAEELDLNSPVAMPEKGDIMLNGVISDTGSVTVTEGTLVNGGDVQVSKTVSKTDTLGRYKVEFNILGKDRQDVIETTKPIYLVIVFDTSGSMICDSSKGAYSYDNYDDAHDAGDRYYDYGDHKYKRVEPASYTAGDGNTIWCSNASEDSSYILSSKWENAVNGAVNFSESFYGMDNNTYISVVTFATNATTAPNFQHRKLSASEFGHPVGATNLKQGILNAQAKLNSITDEDAQKYILVIGDGAPTEGGSYGTSATQAAKNAANNAKAAGTKIFSIGYGIEAGSDAEEVLIDVSSNDEENSNYYQAASVDGLTLSLQIIFEELGELKKAGTNATLTDIVGGAFSIVGKEGNTYTSEVISEITQEGTTMSFEIDIDPNSPTGWYETNDGFNLVYTDSNGVSQTISSDNNPKVYWVNPVFSNESIEKTTNNSLITSSNDVVNYSVNYSVKVEDIEKNSTVTTTIVDTLPYEIDLDKSNLNGGVYDNATKTITWIINKSVISFTEELDINETINYSVVYKNFANVSSLQNNNLVNNVSGQTVVNGKTSIGVNDDASVSVNIKGNLNVSYVDENGNNLIDVISTTEKVGTGYTTSEKEFYGYTFSGVEGETVGQYIEGTINVVYSYTKNDGDVEDTIVKNGPNKINSIDSTFEYTLDYDAVVDNYIGKVSLEVKDVLPFEVLEFIELDDRCEYDSKTNTITCIEEYNINENNKIIDETFKVFVKYKNINNENVVNEVSAKLTNGEIITDDVVTVVQKGKLNVIYKTTDGYVFEQLPETEEFGGVSYTTSEKEFYGYTLTEIPENKDGVYVANSTITVTYVYKKNDGIVEDTIVKNGPDKINSINDTFEYTLNYSAIVDKYVGDVTLKLVDTLPYKISSIIELDKRCSLDASTNKITCLETYKNIDANNKEINDSFKIFIKYENITNEKVNNIVNSELIFGNSNVKNSSNKETIIEKGSVKAIYETTDGVILGETPEEFGLGGSEYTTSEKEFYGYTLTEMPENKDGVYVANSTITVTYIYTKNDGEVSEEVSKDGLETVGGIDSAFNYTITYNGTVDEYVGEVTLEVKDVLPFEIDVEKSNIAGGIYNKEDKTITWTLTKEISENDKVVSFEKEISLYYINVDSDEVSNKVETKLVYGDNEETNEDEFVTIVEKGKLNVIYKTTDGVILEQLPETEEMGGVEYTTSEKEFYGYTLTEMPENKDGVYVANSTITVTYIYTKNDGEVSEEVSKDGLETVGGIDSAFNYTITYNGTVDEYVGEVTLEVKDVLPFEIDVEKSNIAGGTYNKEDKTITWTLTKEISENDKVVSFEKEISLYYINVDSDEVSNKVETKLVYGDNEETNEDEFVTVVEKGKLNVIYKTTDGVILEQLPETEEMGGVEYTTSEKEFYGYTLTEMPENKDGVYVANSTITVTYIYTKNDGEVSEEVSKDGLETVGGIDSAFNYTITYNGTVDEYVGEVTLEVKDVLPFEIDVEKSNIAGGTYNKEDKTITWTLTKEISENDKVVSFEKEISLYYINVDSDEVSNKVETKLVYGDNEETNEDEFVTVVEKGKLNVIYKTTDGVILEQLPETEEMGGVEYTTSEKEFYGYTLTEMPENKDGVYVANSTITVTYIYTKNDGEVSEEVSKDGLETVDGIDSAFNYTITYNGTVDEYVGEVTLEVKDVLPFEIDVEKSNIAGGIYNKEDKTITWTLTKEISENDKVVSFEKEISLYYINVDSDEVSNKVETKLVYGDNEETNEDEFVTIVEKGEVKVYYVIKVDNKYIPLNVYAKDEFGNVLPGFINVDINNVNLIGRIDDIFETSFREIDGHEFIGLYKGNLIDNSYELTKLNGSVISGKFAKEIQEFTYVYDVEKGMGTDIPPMTGVNVPVDDNIKYINYLLLLFVGIFLKKRI